MVGAHQSSDIHAEVVVNQPTEGVAIVSAFAGCSI